MQHITFENIFEKGELTQTKLFLLLPQYFPKTVLTFQYFYVSIFSMDVWNPDESVKMEGDIEHVNKKWIDFYLSLN